MRDRFGWVPLTFIPLAIVGALVLGPHVFATQSSDESDMTWSCSLDNIGATLTLCKSAHPETGLRMYITQIIASSTTTTGGQFILRYGTGTDCGTGTTSLFPASATAARWGYAASTSAPVPINLDPPIPVPAGKDLCFLGVATQTATVEIRGRLRP